MAFVSIEGIDGSGKSTQAGLLMLTLGERGIPAFRTKEPDGGHLGKAVRDILTGKWERRLAPMEEFLLVNAARFDHVQNVIRPEIAAGRWVVCDRFIDSTFAYQVFGGAVPLDAYEAIKSAVVGTTMPDITIILDLPEKVANERRAQRQNTGSDPAEAHRDFGAIRRGLLALADREPHRFHIMDALKPVDAIAAEIRKAVGLA